MLFMAFCIPCPFMNDFITMLVFVWLACFMQGFIEPIMMGIILNVVTPIERPTASSLSILIEMGIGMLPAPYLYGFVQESTKVIDKDGHNISRGGMYLVFFSSGIGAVGLIIGMFLRKRSVKRGAERIRDSITKSRKDISIE